jgi:hypothetical protein
MSTHYSKPYYFHDENLVAPKPPPLLPSNTMVETSKPSRQISATMQSVIFDCLSSTSNSSSDSSICSEDERFEMSRQKTTLSGSFPTVVESPSPYYVDICDDDANYDFGIQPTTSTIPPTSQQADFHPALGKLFSGDTLWQANNVNKNKRSREEMHMALENSNVMETPHGKILFLDY